MTHDPLCPVVTIGKVIDTALGTTLSYDSGECFCAVIDRVREDEAEIHAYRLCDSNYQKGYDAALRDAMGAVTAYADETHKHYGDVFGHCRQEYGDRCDITAALRVAVQKIEGLGPERTTDECQ